MKKLARAFEISTAIASYMLAHRRQLAAAAAAGAGLLEAIAKAIHG